MYRAIVTSKVSPFYTWSISGSETAVHDSVVKAKVATEAWCAQNHGQLYTSFHAFIIDMDKHEIVSWADSPKAALDWQRF
jgi:hypothetical protein